MPAGVRDPSSHRTPEQIRKMDRGYNSQPHIIKRRSMQNQARRIIVKESGEAAVRGKDVDHRKPLREGGKNHKKNLRVISPGRNRGWADGKV